MLPDNENRSCDQHTPVSDEVGQATSEHNQPQQTLGQPEGPASIVLESPIPGYRLKPEIAQGGMGIVYSAECLTFGREVAVKVMKPGMSAAVFNREAQITARLPHPGIPPVHALGKLPDGRPYLVMKLIKGETLDSILKNRSDFSSDRGKLVAVFEHICQAVGFSHAQGIIHRDLKPSNVMVGAFGEVQVMDWGLAREVRGAEEIEPETVVTDQSLTMAGQIKGTPAYMAPEQARGEKLDARADVFALGGMLAAILTGHPPFSGKSVMETISRAAKCDLGETLSRLDASGADPELLALCRRCLEARREDRPADGTELAVAVAEYRAEVENRLLLQIQRERDKLAVVEYGRTMQLAHQEWRDGNFIAMRALLDVADPKLAGWELQYLNRLYDPSIVVFNNNGQTTVSGALSPDGNLAVTLNQNQEVNLWNSKTGQLVDSFNNTKEDFDVDIDYLGSVCFSFDGKYIIATDLKNWCVNVYDINNRELFLVLGNSEGMITCASFSPTGSRILISGWWNNAAILDSITGRETIILQGHVGNIYMSLYSSDGTKIITVGADKSIKTWDANNGLLLSAINFQHRVLALSSRGNFIISELITGGTIAVVHDLKTGQELFQLKGHDGLIKTAIFNLNDSQIITGDYNGRIIIWCLRSGKLLISFETHTFGVSSVSFDAKNKMLLSTGAGIAKIWDIKKRESFSLLSGHSCPVFDASFSPDGNWIVTASADKTAKIWSAKTGLEIFSLNKHKEAVSSAEFSPDGDRIITASIDGTAKVWDAKTGAEIFHFNFKQGELSECFASYSPDGNRILTGGYEQTVKIWDAQFEKQLICFDCEMDERSVSASFSPDGNRIITAIIYGTAKVWDAKTGAELLFLNGKDFSGSASFSPDGNRIVTLCGWKRQTVTVWNSWTGAELLSLTGHTDFINFVGYCPNGNRIVTASSDKTAKLWDANTGAELFSLKGHSGRVTSASFSPDGTRIITAGDDGTAIIWDARPYSESFAEREAAEAKR
jgi:WD40 repeat protein